MIYFVSDVHLGFFERKIDKKKEETFISWLNQIKNNCTVLVLLGDIFDYWFEYKTVIPACFYRTLSMLKDFSNSGIKIEYVMGNHDFGHNVFFENELEITVIKADAERNYFDKKFYLSHGDGKTNNDTGYLILRKILRNKVCQKLFSLIHPDVGISAALACSRRSRNFTATKNYGNSENDGMLIFAKNKIAEGFDFVVMGHRHLVEKKTFQFGEHQGEYINLGEWLENPYYGKFDGNSFELVKYE
jgi:UDP-2,3-diacylglucosamine hydrolase